MTLTPPAVYDSLSGAKRPMPLLHPGRVGLYVCGVTVYDYAHIGHARVYVFFDLVVRYLRSRGYDVTYVRNHTDIDDKIIARAAEVGEEPLALAARFIDALQEDLASLAVGPPSVEPRVSTHIGEIVGMVERLIARGHAYPVDGDVYFEVATFEEYGKLSGQRLEEMRAGERVAVDERKRHPSDFALWKAAKPGEQSWDSPWGPGRPGWHIECSAMSATHLGPSFDVHGGGKDLTFPHHENEIAQSECAHGQTYVGTWMHVGLVQVDGEKMSKSLGNFWTIRDVLARWHPESLRLFLLSAHYRKPVSYSAHNLDLAQERVSYAYRTLAALRGLWRDVERPAPAHGALRARREAWEAGLDDDFNTPVALALLSDSLRRANELLATKKLSRRPDVLAELAALDVFLHEIAAVLGVLGGEPESALEALRLSSAARRGVEPAWVEEQVAARRAARDARDWAEADAIRQRLAAHGVDVMDTPEGTTWLVRLIEGELDGDEAADADSP